MMSYGVPTTVFAWVVPSFTAVDGGKLLSKSPKSISLDILDVVRRCHTALSLGPEATRVLGDITFFEPHLVLVFQLLHHPTSN